MSYSRILDFRHLFLSANQEAQKGKNLIDSYLHQNNASFLVKLLRHHDERAITNRETFLRDHVDYFIEYFSMLSLGHLTGYLGRQDIEEVQAEIAYYLGNAAVKRYYYENYPLLFPQLLLEVIMQKRYFDQGSQSYQTDQEFETFHLLNQTIDNDDVNQFLWFLDGGENDEFDIDDLKTTLSNYARTIAILRDGQEDALGQSVRGFFDYLDFLERFDAFLDSVADPLHQAAYWYYHEYWFSRIKSNLTKSINRFFGGLSRARLITNHFELKSESIEKIQASHQDYLALVNKLITKTDLKKNFEFFLREWRSGDGRYNMAAEIVDPVF